MVTRAVVKFFRIVTIFKHCNPATPEETGGRALRKQPFVAQWKGCVGSGPDKNKANPCIEARLNLGCPGIIFQ